MFLLYSHSGTPAIGCSFKAAAGYLYPLERGFIYVHKPPIHIRFEEVSSVNFARSGGSTRTFDFEVELKSGTVHTFSSIEKEEYSKLFDFITAKKLHVKNRGKNVIILFVFLVKYNEKLVFVLRIKRRIKTILEIRTMRRSRMRIWHVSKLRAKNGTWMMFKVRRRAAPMRISIRTNKKATLPKNTTAILTIPHQKTNPVVLVRISFKLKQH